MAQQTPVGSPRLGVPAGPGGSRPGMNPLPARQQRKLGWLKWVILLPLLLLGLTYLLGRTVEPIRARLAPIPLAGRLLFGKPVWPVLWNKPAEPAAAGGAPAPANIQGTPAAPPANFSKLEAEIAARLAAVEVRETELKRRDEDLAAREAAVKARDAQVAQQELQLGQAVRQAEELRRQLEGQLRADLSRVETIRAMKSGAVGGLFGAMTDQEVLRVLMYMDADEVGKHLSAMDSYRAARLLAQLRQVAPASTTQ